MNKLITTNDQSHSVFSGQYQQHYHSKFGAIQESRHVFIEAGLQEVLYAEEEVKILEIGLGTGLNVLLAYQLAQNKNQPLSLTSIEAYPLEREICAHLNYPTLLDFPKKQFEQIHLCDWETKHAFSEFFTFRKIKTKLEDWIPKENFNVIFFDAFSPEAQPELWTEDIFKKMYDCLFSQGVLVTYSAKGALKRALQSVGFTVEKIPGPPGKREMTRARKC